MPAQRLASAEFPFQLLPHQRAAIRAYESSPDQSRCYLVLPPGAGKTLVGAEIARRAGRKTVVLAPNTAVQGQWVQQWHLLGTDIVSVAEDQALTADITVLTFRDIAGFSEPDPSASDSLPASPHPSESNRVPNQTLRLHPEATDFLRRLASGPPFTLILDGAHHLAAIWGDLLDEVLTEITPRDQDRPAPTLIALTATPRDRLTPDQLKLTDRLFGPESFTVSIPALVRDQALTPFRDLVRFATPTEAERGYLRRSAKPWRELMTGLSDPDFADVEFSSFLNEQWIHGKSSLGKVAPTSPEATGSAAPDSLEDPKSWEAVERTHPEIARALLRVHFDSRLIDLPEGARLTEEHRQPPALEDWVALISDYGRRALATSDSERDRLAWEQIRNAFRSVGWTLTQSGAHRAESSIDLVLMRSAAKAEAAATILRHEHALRGPKMRATITTDLAHAVATPEAELTDVLSDTAGTAYEALLQADRTLPETGPVLVTDEVVAGSTETMLRLAEFIANGNPELAQGLRSEPVPETDGIVSLSGPGWRPRVWIPIVTGWFLAGGTHILVGTRNLLGEGWDAASLNVLVDLTAASSATSVVQIRGRAFRKDPADPRKSAHIWSVVVVSDDHARGDLDYRRFVTQHERLRGVDAAGQILTGSPHVDASCNPFSPPGPKERTAVNNRMMDAAARSEELPELWGVDHPYADVDAQVVQVRGCGGEPPHLDVPQAALRPYARTRGLVPATGAAVGAALPIIAAAPPGQALVWAGIGGLAGWGADAGSRWAARRRAKARMSSGDTLLAIGMAVARSMNFDPAQVDVAPDGDGVWRVIYSGREGVEDSGRDSLGNPSRDEFAQLGSARPRTDVDSGQRSFVSGMEQVLSPMAWPRYMVSRQLPQKKPEIWHAVPESLGMNRQSADRFHRAWVEFVSDGRLVETNSPEGAEILAAVRGRNPSNVEIGMRLEWH